MGKFDCDHFNMGDFSSYYNFISGYTWNWGVFGAEHFFKNSDINRNRCISPLPDIYTV